MSQVVTLGTRSYLAVEPAGTGPWPVVLMLHGAGGTAEWTVRETRWNLWAEREGFLLVLPEATRPNSESPASFLANPQVWNDGAGDDWHPPRPHVDDVAFLDVVLDDVASRFAIDPARVYLAGFSNGAAMTFRYASERTVRLAAIAPVAGYCVVSPRPTMPLPTLYIVGTADPLVPLYGGEVTTPWGRARVTRRPVRDTLTRWARALGCNEESLIRDVRDGVIVEEFAGPVRYRAITIEDHGHHWPGGRGELLRRIAGPPSDRLDACREVWNFFRLHAAAR